MAGLPEESGSSWGRNPSREAGMAGPPEESGSSWGLVNVSRETTGAKGSTRLPASPGAPGPRGLSILPLPPHPAAASTIVINANTSGTLTLPPTNDGVV